MQATNQGDILEMTYIRDTYEKEGGSGDEQPKGSGVGNADALFT
jgi:hypothetical protein